jgi:hypothetical protein
MEDHALTFSSDGVEYMKLCVDVALYWRGSAFDHVKGLLHFYREAISLIGGRLTFFEREEMQGAEPITRAALDQVPDWLTGSDRTKDVFTLDLETSRVKNIPSDTAFRFWADEYPEEPAGKIRLVLPVSFVAEAPQSFVKLALSLAKELRFHSGHAGYAINWDHRGDYALASRKSMSVLATRYPAIDFADEPTTLMAIPTGMKRINWITFVGNDLVAQKGLQLDLEGLEVHPMPHGIAVVAGDRPRVGDVNRQEDLTAYYKVGRALAGLRSHDHPPLIPDKQGDPEEDRTEEWLSYFER